MTETAEQAQAGAPQAEVQQEADDQVYCICRRPEAGFMVFCDGCEDWFHGDCVGIKKRQADKLSKYMCPNCAPPTPSKAAPVTPDAETSKSRSGRSIKKKKYDEEEFEYDFKSKDEDEDYEEEDSEDEKPTRKATPKKVSTPQHHHQQPPQQQQQHQQHHHLQQHTPTQQQHHHQQQPPSMYYNSNTNHSPYAHPNHLNLVGHNNHSLPSYNLNPTLQAINSINNFALNPHGHISPPSTHHMQLPPHLMSPLSHTLPHSPQSQPLMGQMPISGLQGPPPGSKRSYPTTPQPTKSSPEAQPKMARRESFPPPGVKGDKKEKEQEKDPEVSIRNSLSEVLGNAAIATAIEAALLKVFPSPKSKEYKVKARSLLFNLRDPKNLTLKERILSGAITPEKFVSMEAKDYATGELAEWRRAQELKSIQSVKIQPEDEDHAKRLEAMVKDESASKEATPAKDEAEKVLSPGEGDADEENTLKKEKESVDIDIDIDANSSSLSIPLLPVPTSGSALPPPISSSSTAPVTISTTPAWKGDLDQVAVGVEVFSVRAYHLSGPHVDTLLSKVTSMTAKGKLEFSKLSDHLTEKIDSSPHRTRSLVMLEPAAASDDYSYQTTWEYCFNNRSPVVICDTNPPISEDDESTSTTPRIDQLYVFPLDSPDDIPDFAFPPNMNNATRRMSLRQAGQRPNRPSYLLAIIVTRLPHTPSKNGSKSPSSVSPSSPASPSITSAPHLHNSSSPTQQQQHHQPQQQQHFMQQQAFQQQANYNLPPPTQMFNNNMYQQQQFQQFHPQQQYQQFPQQSNQYAQQQNYNPMGGQQFYGLQQQFNNNPNFQQR